MNEWMNELITRLFIKQPLALPGPAFVKMPVFCKNVHMWQGSLSVCRQRADSPTLDAHLNLQWRCRPTFDDEYNQLILQRRWMEHIHSYFIDFTVNRKITKYICAIHKLMEITNVLSYLSIYSKNQYIIYDYGSFIAFVISWLYSSSNAGPYLGLLTSVGMCRNKLIRRVSVSFFP